MQILMDFGGIAEATSRKKNVFSYRWLYEQLGFEQTDDHILKTQKRKYREYLEPLEKLYKRAAETDDDRSSTPADHVTRQAAAADGHKND